MIKENKTYDSAFFYLTIKGDTLNPEELNNVLNLPCDIFHKGEITFKEYKGKQIYSITQKTNRWVYKSDFQYLNNEDINRFVWEQLSILNSYKSVLQPYFEKYYSFATLSVYMDNKSYILLNSKLFHLLDTLGVDLELEFQ